MQLCLECSIDIWWDDVDSWMLQFKSGYNGFTTFYIILHINPFFKWSLNLFELSYNFHIVTDNLCELLVDELLPTGKKLRSWPNHPFKHLSTVTNGHDRSRLLAAWLYESKLKVGLIGLCSNLCHKWII